MLTEEHNVAKRCQERSPWRWEKLLPDRPVTPLARWDVSSYPNAPDRRFSRNRWLSPRIVTSVLWCSGLEYAYHERGRPQSVPFQRLWGPSSIFQERGAESKVFSQPGGTQAFRICVHRWLLQPQVASFRQWRSVAGQKGGHVKNTPPSYLDWLVFRVLFLDYGSIERVAGRRVNIAAVHLNVQQRRPRGSASSGVLPELLPHLILFKSFQNY